MTVKVNLDHFRNEITLRLGQNQSLVRKKSYKPMHNVLPEVAYSQTEKPTRSYNIRLGGGKRQVAIYRQIDVG